MYCPYCGHKLTLKTKEVCEKYEYPFDSTLHREEYICEEGCKMFGIDCPLYLHQPFQGIYSAPGDSWSLSWIK